MMVGRSCIRRRRIIFLIALFLVVLLFAGCKVQIVEKKNASNEIIIEEIVKPSPSSIPPSAPSPAPAVRSPLPSANIQATSPVPSVPAASSQPVQLQQAQPQPVPAEPPREQAVAPLRPFSTLPYQPPVVNTGDAASSDVLLQRPVNTIRVHMLNVGDGESILVESEKTMLIDCGPEEFRKKTAEYLRQQGIATIDALVLSNLERERIGGCPYILREFDVKRIIQNDLESDDAAYKRIKEIVEEEEIGMEQLLHDVNFTFDQNIDAELHVPYDKGTLSEMGSHTLVVRLIHGAVSFLFAGDCGKGCERIFYENQSLDYAVTVYGIGEHAEQDSATRLLFSNLSAQIGLLSANRSLDIEQADPDVVRRYVDHGLRVYRTDYDGTIVVTSDGYTYDVSVSKGIEHWKEGTAEETVFTPSPDCPYVAHYNSIFYYTFDCPLAKTVEPNWRLCFANNALANATGRRLDPRCG